MGRDERTLGGSRPSERGRNLQRVTGVHKEAPDDQEGPSMSPSSIGRLCAGAAVSLMLFVVVTGAPATAQTHASVQTHAL